MGTSIELCIGSISLSYSKNQMGIDYGFLFQNGDLTRRKSKLIDYEYYEENPDLKHEIKKAEELFVRTLRQIVPRLNLLGHTLDTARAEYNSLLEQAETTLSGIHTGESKIEYLNFDEFCNLACRHPISSLKEDYIQYDTSEGLLASDHRLFDRIPLFGDIGLYWSEASYLASRVCILSAESMLQVFAQNAENSDIEVTWAFGPIVEAGWVQREEFRAGALQKQKILIATEGTSDTRIIKRALAVLHPDVVDFFNFVDVDERHPYWGTGNLVKFAEGLLRIEIINKVLFVFDNDAEGVEAFHKFEKLSSPTNMRAMLLPDLDEFNEFTTLGPEGVSVSDINGKAAAIECYLDLNLRQYPAARVTWNNFKKDLGVWHGTLDHKESYSKYFYGQSNDQLIDGTYDVSKLLKLVSKLIQEASLLIQAI